MKITGTTAFSQGIPHKALQVWRSSQMLIVPEKKQTVTPSPVAGSAPPEAIDAGSAATPAAIVAATDACSAAIAAIEVEEGEEDEAEDPATVDKASQVPMDLVFFWRGGVSFWRV